MMRSKSAACIGLFLSWLLIHPIAPVFGSDQRGTSIQEAAAAVNAKAAAQGHSVLPLTNEGFLYWYRSRRLLNFNKKQRAFFDRYFSRGLLPPTFFFDVQSFHGIPARISLTGDPGSVPGTSVVGFPSTVASGDAYETWENLYLPILSQEPASIEEPLFAGTAVSPVQSGSFPASVQVQIQEVRLKLEEGRFETDALLIYFRVNKNNLDALASYFGAAYPRTAVRARLQSRLGNANEKWIPITDILLGWAGRWVNRFPAEKTRKDGTGMTANDVCHGVARQFFQYELKNGNEDRSTEASENLLRSHYQLLPESVEPTFGDYLYLPWQHSIRFIMKDPASGRWIGFSSWSSRETPYRLWWVDQDYSSPTLGRARIRPEFPRTMDVWRRNPNSRRAR